MPARERVTSADIPADVLLDMARDPAAFESRIKQFSDREKAAKSAEKKLEAREQALAKEEQTLAFTRDWLEEKAGDLNQSTTDLAAREKAWKEERAQDEAGLEAKGEALRRRDSDQADREKALNAKEARLGAWAKELEHKAGELVDAKAACEAESEAAAALKERLTGWKRSVSDLLKGLPRIE